MAIPNKPSGQSWLSRIKTWLVTNPNNPGLETKYNYQAFHSSRYLFFFGGRIRTVKRNPAQTVSILLRNLKPLFPVGVGILIVLPLVLFLVYEAKWLWHHISGSVVILFVYGWIHCFVGLLRASYMDPGVLPRNIHITDNAERVGLPAEYNSSVTMPGYKRAHGDMTGSYKPQSEPEVQIKYCPTCKIWRPPRASHCSYCNVCIMNMDHHCRWLNTCVGQRNKRFFLSFLFGTVTSCIWIIVLSFVHIFAYRREHPDISLAHSLRDVGASLFLVIYCLLGVIFPGLLLFYHFMLGITGITTREYYQIPRGMDSFEFLRNIWASTFNTHSYWKNLMVQWCQPRGTSTVRMRDRYQQGDMRFESVEFGAII
ncbi:unnamed protein product [Kuraishia capsulata CBS 1993]|uniref:Palmitoyltransferase n=1 Tax=Kuraishia capsulata CBS 1993 TaxID=1382522 RepID=W6MJE8_9ASCO|nr:uncharacterized protein KUCA_T00000518001 [Kuraishia capsulata CBS 1993]CDK24552.1 unnamed protein product [Kuraishia capsulata CBS 1993]